jgi:hypothetical protein
MVEIEGTALLTMSFRALASDGGVGGDARVERRRRMSANGDLSTGTRAGVRKPPKNETGGVGHPADQRALVRCRLLSE